MDPFLHDSKKLRKVATLLIGASALVIMAWQVSRYFGFIIDDSYISLVYAKNLIQGQGLTFNGMRVAGYSNFLVTTQPMRFSCGFAVSDH
jgi:ABC-type thiamine transport system substrate-binding protein